MKVVAGALALLASAGLVTSALLEGLGPSQWLLLALGTPPLALGLLIARRRPELGYGWLLLAVACTFGLGALGLGLHGQGAILAGQALSSLLAVFYGLLWVFLPLLFPDGHLPSSRWRPVAWAGALGIAVHWAGTVFIPVGVVQAEVRPPSFAGWPPPAMIANALGQFVVYAVSMIVFCGLLVRWRRAQERERRQLRWLAVGGLANMVGMIATTIGAAGDPSVFAMGVLLAVGSLPAAIAVALVRHRLLDLRVGVRGSRLSLIFDLRPTVTELLSDLSPELQRAGPGEQLAGLAEAVRAGLDVRWAAVTTATGETFTAGTRGGVMSASGTRSGRTASGTHDGETVTSRASDGDTCAPGSRRGEVSAPDARRSETATSARSRRETATPRTRADPTLALNPHHDPQHSSSTHDGKAATPGTHGDDTYAPGAGHRQMFAPDTRRSDTATSRTHDGKAATRGTHDGDTYASGAGRREVSAPDTYRGETAAPGIRGAEPAATLVVAGGLGQLACGPKIAGRFTSEDRRLLRAFAVPVGLAIQSAALAGRLVNAQEAERRRLERDIHDGVQQQLVALIAGLELARASGDGQALLPPLREQAQRTLDDLRELAAGIHPSVLGQGGLVEAVESRCSRLPVATTVLADPGLRATRFADEVEGALYFTVSEAVTNALKHAGAGRMEVRLSRGDGRLRAEVRDDGRGFDETAVARRGLAALADRLSALGGDLKVTSTVEEGTTVEAWVPAHG
ncbi:sensor histidine kinase [Nonomuraea longicatena]|uniref:Histidine kinase/HSP90-like ATPase domain-containing protein n=1 Tax=Nonomuraea longicatena TaxID=83682 RepID=A0ABP3Z7M8_9ACTN